MFCAPTRSRVDSETSKSPLQPHWEPRRDVFRRFVACQATETASGPSVAPPIARPQVDLVASQAQRRTHADRPAPSWTRFCGFPGDEIAPNARGSPGAPALQERASRAGSTPASRRRSRRPRLISAAVTSSGGIQRTTSCCEPQVRSSSPASAQAALSRSGSEPSGSRGRAVANELHADHQPGPRTSPMRSSSAAIRSRPARQLRAARRGVRDEPLRRDRLEDREAGGAGDRVAAVRRAVRAAAPALLELARRHDRRERQAVGDRLGEHHDVRDDPGVLEAPTSARSARSRTGPRRR